MDRWTALLPDKPSARTTPPIQLIGRLPANCYIAILQQLPVPDISTFALVSRKFAQLAKDDRVWRRKLDWLNYTGPGSQRKLEGDLEAGGDRRGQGEAARDKGKRISKADGLLAPRNPPPTPAPAPTPRQGPPPSPFFAAPDDDEFGDFFQGNGDVSLVQDDGFGDFVDFGSGGGGGGGAPPPTRDPFGNHSSGNGVGKPAKRAAGPGDLMMMFDEDDVDARPPPSTRPPNDSHLTFQSARPPPPTPTLPLSKKPHHFPSPQPNIATPLSPFASLSTPLETFKTYHSILLPYYLSLQTHTTSSLIFTSTSLSPQDRSRILSALVRFCSAPLAPSRSLPQRTTVLRNVQSATDFFETTLLAEFERADNRGDEVVMKAKAKLLWDLNASNSVAEMFVERRAVMYDQTHDPLKNLVRIETPSGEAADGVDFSAMDTYMKNLLYIVSREGSLIARVFPPEADFLIYFTERIANDVLSDYITSLLSAAQALQHPLFLLATAATFGQVYRLVDTVLEVEPKSELVTKERAEDVIFKMFEPLMDDYLQEEADWIREVLEGICTEWDKKTEDELALSDPTFLSSRNPAQVKRNVLAGFTKVLLLPVTIIPKTASFGLNAITVGATGAFNTIASGFGATNNLASKSRALVTPVNTLKEEVEKETPWSADSPPVSVDNLSLPSLSISIEDIKSPTIDSRFDRLQLLLSLDTALQLIQSNRDCLKRVQTFARYPGTYGLKVRDTIEEVFIILLQTLAEKHVGPGFAKATEQMNGYSSDEFEVGKSVAPLVQFFELVHIGDTIQQMVEVYFDKEMASYIDKKDFLNTVVREKKRFEMTLDDAVAQGLNAGVNILMNQVEFIILTHQGPRDFCPTEGDDMDLQPTKACREAIEVLETHCNMLKGSTDKQILEVFHQEVGIRLHGILLKHLKRLIISIEGGFQLISDLNAYHAFVSSLRQPNITSYFTSLKMVGEIYVIDSPKDLGQLVRDVSRYEGTLSADDLYECVQRRADWGKIGREVEKIVFGLQLGSDCVLS